MESLPANIPLGIGSGEHSRTLISLGRCLRAAGRSIAAEEQFRKAQTQIDILLAHNPEHNNYTNYRSVVLNDLGNALRDQQRYPEARTVYEAALEVDQKLGDARAQAVTLSQLGTLALSERNYPEAKTHYEAAISFFKTLEEPRMEATGWYQLGRVFYEEAQWAEAERCLRNCLQLEESIRDEGGSALTYDMLGNVTRMTEGRSEEAENWYRRALETSENVTQPRERSRALSNLASLIASEVRARRAPISRLKEARALAEQALTIERTLDASVALWKMLGNCADIAEQDGDGDAARRYRREERQSYAASPGNRGYVDKVAGKLIPRLAAAVAREDHRPELVRLLDRIEAKGGVIADPIRRIWAGERDWHTLSEGIDVNSALFILRVLETLQDLENPPTLP